VLYIDLRIVLLTELLIVLLRFAILLGMKPGHVRHPTRMPLGSPLLLFSTANRAATLKASAGGWEGADRSQLTMNSVTTLMTPCNTEGVRWWWLGRG
jgi:hypothetical protein